MLGNMMSFNLKNALKNNMNNRKSNSFIQFIIHLVESTIFTVLDIFALRICYKLFM